MEEIKNIDENSKFSLILSLKQLITLGATLVTIVGTAFGLGIKITTEAEKVKALKQEQEFQKQLAAKDELLIEANRKIKEVKEDNLFFTDQYKIVKDRLDNCMEEKGLIDKIDEMVKDK